MKKLEVTIKEQWIEMGQRHHTNWWDTFHCKVEINGVTFNYQSIKNINGYTYNNDYIYVGLFLDMLNNVNTYLEFNKFKNCVDVIDFQNYYGFTDTQKICETINNIKKIAKLSKSAYKKITKKYGNDKMYEILDIFNDGSIEKYKKIKPFLDNFFKIIIL